MALNINLIKYITRLFLVKLRLFKHPDPLYQLPPAAIPVVTSKGSPNIVGSSVVAGSSVTTSEVSTSTAGVLQGNAASRQSFNYKFIVGLILAYIIA